MSKKTKTGLFMNVKSLTFASMLVALSVILGWIGRTYFTFGAGISAFRITFENLPIITAGFLFGPIAGGLVGIIADLVSCLVAPQPSINPIITLGAFCVGFFSGLIFKTLLRGKKNIFFILISSLISHFIGSVLVKTMGFWVYYSYPFLPTLLLRGVTYLFIGTAEGLLLYYVLKNRNIISLINKLTEKKGRR